jgi:AcrR family transcriptional regulator
MNVHSYIWEIMAQEKKNKILLKAKEVIAKKGYYGASMKEIAKKAGVAQGTPYVYYKSKEDLFIELLLTFESRIDSIIQEAVQMDTDFWGRIENIIRSMARFMEEDNMMMNIMKREMPEPLGIGRKGLNKIKEIREKRSSRIQHIFKDIRGNTELNENFTEEEIMRSCMMVIMGMMKALEHGEEKDPSAAADLAIKSLKEALLKR